MASRKKTISGLLLTAVLVGRSSSGLRSEQLHPACDRLSPGKEGGCNRNLSL